MTAVWPVALPKRAVLRGATATPQNNTLSFQPESGPSIDRRRGTAAGKKWSMTFAMSAAQFEIFVVFFEEVLKDGTLPFTMPHPFTGATRTWKFGSEKYQQQELTNRSYTVTLDLLELH